MALSSAETKAYYDRFGSKQDKQGFYEEPATDLLVEHGRFGDARAVFEFGAGTGKFAERLLSGPAPDVCAYHGIDISETMVALARQRLKRFGERASVALSDGGVKLAPGESRYDRFVVNYVLDLLPEERAKVLLSEARRILTDGGLFCAASLSHGRTFPAKIVSGIWNTIYRANAKLVGGCRPIDVAGMLPASDWEIEFHTVVSSFGLTSEVVIARKPG